MAHYARDREIRGKVYSGIGVRFLADTIEERDRISGIVMSTLALDLLDFGYKKQNKPASQSNETAGTPSHPIRWKRPAVNNTEGSTGSTEITLRLQATEPPRDNIPQADDLSGLWDLDEILQGLASPSLHQ